MPAFPQNFRGTRKLISTFFKSSKAGQRNLYKILTREIQFDDEESFRSSITAYIKKHFPAKLTNIANVIKTLWTKYQSDITKTL